MAQPPDLYVYLVQQQDFLDHTDEDGHLSVLECYGTAKAARRCAKATANHLYRQHQLQRRGDIARPPEETADVPDERYSTEVYLYDHFSGIESSFISVKKMYCSPTYISGEYTSDEDDDDEDDEDDEDDGLDWGFDQVGPGSGPGRGFEGTIASTLPTASHGPSAPVPIIQPASRSNTQANNFHQRSTNSSFASLTTSLSSHQPINRSRSLTHPSTRPTTNSRNYASYIDHETGFRKFIGTRNRNRTDREMLEEAIRNNVAARQAFEESASRGFGNQ
jgi:hypothetical protein